MLGCGVTAPGCAAALKGGPPLERLPAPDPPPCTAPLAWAPPEPPPPWPPPPPPPPAGLPRAAIEMPSRSAARIGRIRNVQVIVRALKRLLLRPMHGQTRNVRRLKKAS